MATRYLIDCTVTVATGLRTGVQRVVRRLAGELAATSARAQPTSLGARFVPIACVNGAYVELTLDLPAHQPFAGSVHIRPLQEEAGSELLILDSWWAWRSLAPLLAAFPAHPLSFVLYDLIPLRFPDFVPAPDRQSFERDLRLLCTSARSICCISEHVKSDFQAWLGETGVSCPGRIEAFPLGCHAAPVRPPVARAPDSYLMVGTIEARKGYPFVLDCFEEIWRSGGQANLTVVGTPGALAQPLLQRFEHLSKTYGRLRRLAAISDEDLEDLYACSTALICASTAEGFGLPLVEGIQRRMPVIASDIAVFREVAGDYPVYVRPGDRTGLIRAIRSGAFAPGQAPHLASWPESAQRLRAILIRP